MTCWHCHALIDLPSSGKLSSRASCDRCLHDLHCCANCTHYKPGAYNNCAVASEERISSFDKNNLCEEFVLKKEQQDRPRQDPKTKFEALFS